MSGTMYNGISLSTTSNGLVEDNFVQGFLDMDSWIIVRDASSNITVTHNTTQSVINYQGNGVPNPNYVESGTSIVSATAATDLSTVNAWLAQHAATTVVGTTPDSSAVSGGVGAVVVPAATTIGSLVQHEIAMQLSSDSLNNLGWAIL
jgi:hypothetical protein